jgi:hypothetical protein
MSIHNADQALISGVVFKNITIESAQEIGDGPTNDEDDFLVDMSIAFNTDWSKSGNVRGQINGVTFENINILEQKDTLKIRLNGFGQNNRIQNVTFRDFYFKGAVLNNQSQLAIGNFVENVRFENSGIARPTGASPYRYYEIEADSPLEIQEVSPPDQTMIKVPEFAQRQLTPPYAGVKIESVMTARSTYGTTAANWGSAQEGDNDLTGYAAANVLANDENLWQGRWNTPSVTGEFIALTIYFDSPKLVGSLRLFGIENSEYFAIQNIGIYSCNRITDGNYIFSNKTVGINYEFSGAKGNFVDIKITPGEYRALQLRFYKRIGMVYTANPFLRYIEFYPASLTYGKAPHCSDYEDVYNPEKITDGDINSYFESKKGAWPGWIAIDMEQPHSVSIIVLNLPPLSSWPDRTMEIEIQYLTGAFDQNGQWQTLIARTSYEFKGENGNMVTIQLPQAVNMQTIRLSVWSNSSVSGEAAQFSEISCYE